MDAEKSVSIAGPQGRSGDEVIQIAIRLGLLAFLIYWSFIIQGRGLSTPVVVIFVGVLGGTLAYGILGLFVGPIILAVAWELLTAWMSDTDCTLDLNQTSLCGGAHRAADRFR
jgi:hypothetical protein